MGHAGWEFRTRRSVKAAPEPWPTWKSANMATKHSHRLCLSGCKRGAIELAKGIAERCPHDLHLVSGSGDPLRHNLADQQREDVALTADVGSRKDCLPGLGTVEHFIEWRQ